jgi:hypothetical protein
MSGSEGGGIEPNRCFLPLFVTVQKSYDQHKFRADERWSQDLAPRIKRPQASARQRVVVEENGRCAVYRIHEERWLWERWYCQGLPGHRACSQFQREAPARACQRNAARVTPQITDFDLPQVPQLR